MPYSIEYFLVRYQWFIIKIFLKCLNSYTFLIWLYWKIFPIQNYKQIWENKKIIILSYKILSCKKACKTIWPGLSIYIVHKLYGNLRSKSPANPVLTPSCIFIFGKQKYTVFYKNYRTQIWAWIIRSEYFNSHQILASMYLQNCSCKKKVSLYFIYKVLLILKKAKYQKLSTQSYWCLLKNQYNSKFLNRGDTRFFI